MQPIKTKTDEYKEKAITVINEIATKEKIPDLILYTTGIGLLYITISYAFVPIFMLYKKYHSIEV